MFARPTLAVVAIIGMTALATAGSVPQPTTVTVPAGAWQHRLDGDYTRAGRPVDAPRVRVELKRPIEIMRDMVTAADYGRCVTAGACRRPDDSAARPDLPVTGVNHSDANDYARWLSRETGMRWRLPTDQEWARAAGSRFVDDARGLDETTDDPARRWLADYEREAARKAAGRDPAPRPVGSFGANEYGLRDAAGNVWEWTSTCHRRVTIDAADRVVDEKRICGIYILAGQHRTPMPFFVRNPKSGACSVGLPPDNLGFRLVREPNWGSWLRGLLVM